MSLRAQRSNPIINTFKITSALYATWDHDIGKFVIRGEATDETHVAVEKCMQQKLRMAIDFEDSGSTQVVWQGYIYHADFQVSEHNEMECSLTMLLDDWWGIFPGFSSFYFC